MHFKAHWVIRKFARQLPHDISFLGVGERWLFPLNDEDGKAMAWVIYLQKLGNSEKRPALNQAAGSSSGVFDLGDGWKLGKVVIPPELVNNAEVLVKVIQEVITELKAA